MIDDLRDGEYAISSTVSDRERRQRAGRRDKEASPLRGTVHRTCLNSIKTKKVFLGCEKPRKIFLQVARWASLDPV